jgi:hypothetical protein
LCLALQAPMEHLEHLEHLAPTLLFPALPARTEHKGPLAWIPQCLAPKGRLALIRLCQVRRAPQARTERKGRQALIQ